jgi:hypothetical protein
MALQKLSSKETSAPLAAFQKSSANKSSGSASLVSKFTPASVNTLLSRGKSIPMTRPSDFSPAAIGRRPTPSKSLTR